MIFWMLLCLQIYKHKNPNVNMSYYHMNLTSVIKVL